MAIVMCPDCNANVSDRAITCSQCGYPINKYVRKLEQQIKKKEKDLESLYHGHRWPVALILLVICIFIMVPFLFVPNEDMLKLLPGNSGNIIVILVIAASVIGLVIIAILGRPSTRPEIPKVKKEIQELNEEINRLKSGGQITA